MDSVARAFTPAAWEPKAEQLLQPRSLGSAWASEQTLYK